MSALLPSSNWPGLFSTPDLRVTAGAWSIKGSGRDNNEDCDFISPKHDLFIVADGMGGHAAGERASRFVVDTLTHELARLCDEAHTTGEIKKLVRDAMEEAHCLVVEMGELLPELRGSGSTAVLALLFGTRLFVAGVGDSLAYLLRDTKLEKLTDDDSFCAMLESAGAISHEDVKTHPARHQLLAALGVEKFPPNKEIRVLDVRPGDRFLLCTDGVTDVVDSSDIVQILEDNRNCRAAARRLVDKAVKMGTTDDATCVVFAIHEVVAKVREPEFDAQEGIAGRLWRWLVGEGQPVAS